MQKQANIESLFPQAMDTRSFQDLETSRKSSTPESLEEAWPADTLISHSWPSEVCMCSLYQRICFYCLKPYSL
jgi:hypothetical protein